jgi:hypothetical protein
MSQELVRRETRQESTHLRTRPLSGGSPVPRTRGMVVYEFGRELKVS